MKRRILYVHHASLPGGAPNSLALLIGALDKRRYDPMVLMPQRSVNGKVVELFESSGATVIQERHIRPFNAVNGCEGRGLKKRLYCLAGALPTAMAVRKHVRRLAPDLLHTNSLVLPFALFGSLLADSRVPRIAHVREMRTANVWGRLLSWLNRIFANQIIGIDQSGLDAIGADASRSAVIHNSIPYADQPLPGFESRTEWRDRLRVNSSDVVFLSLSRIAESNGILEMARLIKRTGSRLNSRAIFLVAGFSPEHASDYQRLAEAELGELKQVRVMGYVDDVVGILAASDVIVAPYSRSHSSRAVLEGAACGRPALVSDLPNLTEMIRPDSTGKAFRLDDADGFVDAIDAFCVDEERERMGAEARRFAEQHYSQAANAKRIQSIYDSLLAPGKAAK